MANSYFTLTTSDSSKSKRFKVISTGYANILEKAQTINRTIDGALDVSSGSIQEKYVFTIKVRYDEPSDITLGTLADLRYFYSLNNPNGTPSNIMTMIDHYGSSISVIMTGEFNYQNLGVMIDGTDAWFIVNCTFMKI